MKLDHIIQLVTNSSSTIYATALTKEEVLNIIENLKEELKEDKELFDELLYYCSAYDIRPEEDYDHSLLDEGYNSYVYIERGAYVEDSLVDAIREKGKTIFIE